MRLLAIAVGTMLIAFNGAFVALEFGLIGAMRSAIDSEARKGRRSAVAAKRLQSDVLTTLGGAQLGITVCSLIVGRLVEPAVASLIESLVHQFGDISDALLHSISFALALGMIVVMHMVLGEMVPKNLAITGPERTLLLLARPMAAYLLVARPIVRSLLWFSNGLVRLVRVEPASELDESTTPAELSLMVDESHDQGLIDHEEYALIESALAFSVTLATSVMAQMNEVHSVAANCSISEIERRIVATGHTRLVVHGRGIHDVRGCVHSKDLLALEAGKRTLDSELIRPMLRVGPDSTLPDVLQLMQRSRIHLALVTSQGTNYGVLTLDDVMRGLVGGLIQDVQHD